MSESASESSIRIKEAAAELGFYLCGIAPAGRPDTLDFFHQWLSEGRHGEMGYMDRRREAYAHPGGVLPDVRSLILVGLNYFPEFDATATVGQIAKYAAGQVDYHDLVRERLRQLSGVIHQRHPGCHTRVVVDTAPLLERDFARLAGLGWFGKNTMLINRWHGSFFFLGAILTDIELNPDPPHVTSHCGTCTRCLEACPTDAFDGPYVLDARKCVSYLTIELRDQPIPRELRSGVGEWLFGCDVCQDVCPWNRRSRPTNERSFQRLESLSREAVMFLTITEEEFRERFRHVPFWRPGRANMARNAAIVLGNTRDARWSSILQAAIDDQSPVVRGACAWSLGQIRNPQSRETLLRRKAIETHVEVIQEIELALQALDGV